MVGVLIRFRKEKVALLADIEAMFNQVRVHEEDCDALRFLWWPNGDFSQQPRHYCMQVHLFGVTSSPSCTAFALKKTASDHANEFESEVVATVKRNIYVDDCLKSVSSEKQAIDLASDLRQLLKKGGFRLTKWISNNRNVINSIPESELAPSLVNLNPSEILPQERALGVWWDVNTDTIRFQIKLPEKSHTEEYVSSIYDPLGLVSPVTLKAKAIVQNLSRQKIDWDEQIPDKDTMDWLMWTSSLPGNVENTQLHMFSDGSEAGYGACAYLRLVDENGNVTCSLVHGKARLAPLKKMTIPRLEVSGAVLPCRIFKMLQEELDIQIDQTRFWSDSTIVLGYIKNESKRFKTFVGNRISIIHDLTAPDQWCYVDSASNPADIASRGISASDSYIINTWLNGPEFLCRDASFWPHQKPILRVLDEDEEVKREVAVHAVTSNSLDNLLDYFSEWNALIKAVCWFTRFQTYCKQRYLKKDVHCPAGRLTLNERRDAIHNIIAYNQHSHFFNDFNTLKKGVSVGKSSCLQCLNPVLVDVLVRVKGRHSDPDDNKLLIVLPNKGHITNLIVRHLHDTNGHVGIGVFERGILGNKGNKFCEEYHQ